MQKTQINSSEFQQEDADDRLRDKIIEALKTVRDPELSVNIYDLGLVYEINFGEEQQVVIRMTLTSPACPVAQSLPGQVEMAVKQLAGVPRVIVEIVWDPPWNKNLMNEEARLSLNLF